MITRFSCFLSCHFFKFHVRRVKRRVLRIKRYGIKIKRYGIKIKGYRQDVKRQTLPYSLTSFLKDFRKKTSTPT